MPRRKYYARWKVFCLFINFLFQTSQLKASQFCQRHQMQLVSITTEEENEEIRQLLLHHSKWLQAYMKLFRIYTQQLIGDNISFSNNFITFCLLGSAEDSFWTSARKSSEKDKWTWSTGTSMIFSNLKGTENLRRNAYCIEVLHGGDWNEQGCDEERYFICEKTSGLKICPKVHPVLNIYVNNENVGKNISLPYAFFKIGNATFDTIPEIPDPF